VQFLNPTLIAGALLFAVPLVIHLLNRQRHKRRPWAAMDFLLRAYQKQKNRLRNENLLLLLLRCLLPILLALAVARPILDAAKGLFGGQGLVHHVVVVDGTYSMGLRLDGAPSPFDRARALVGRLLDGFERNPARTDKVTIVHAGVRPRFLVANDLDLSAARSAHAQLDRPDDGAGDLGEALRQVADALEQTKDGAVQLYVFGDLQQRALGGAPAGTGDAPELTDTVRDSVERLQKLPGAQLHWIDVGPFAAATTGGAADNVQLTDLRMNNAVAVLRTPVEFVATIRNRGTAAANCEVTLDVDGAEPVRKVVTVPAGAEGEADFRVTFREPGRRRVRAALVPDALAADDERYLSVPVRERVRVLVVDGEAAGDPLRSYAYAFRSLLDPDASALPTFSVETTDLVRLLGGQVDPQEHDVVVLADVERLNHRAATTIADAVRAGRGLLVMAGERTEIESFNLHLFAGGDGPLPGRLLGPRGGAAGSATVRAPRIVDARHGALREFEEDVYREILQAIPTWRWHAVAADGLAADAQVVLRLDDAEQSPLLVARPFGEGRIALLTSPLASEFKADRWNRFDDPLAAFPLLHGLVKWLALPATDPFQAPVGGQLTCSLPARPDNLGVQRPERDGRLRSLVAEESQPLPGGRFALPAFGGTAFAGFYVFDCVLERRTGKEAVQLPFAVNLDPAEGDLRYLGHAEAKASIGVDRVLVDLPVTARTSDEQQRSELGPTLLLLTLLLLLAEAALARHVAARRS
jgi:hypothetical protein